VSKQDWQMHKGKKARVKNLAQSAGTRNELEIIVPKNDARDRFGGQGQSAETNSRNGQLAFPEATISRPI
jgi:hypothetical protein